MSYYTESTNRIMHHALELYPHDEIKRVRYFIAAAVQENIRVISVVNLQDLLKDPITGTTDPDKFKFDSKEYEQSKLRLLNQYINRHDNGKNKK